MLLYFTFTLNILMSTAFDSQLSNPYPFLVKFEFPFEPDTSYDRFRRDDKLRHNWVCGELDKTEDTPFVVIIITQHSGRLLCMGSIIDEYHVLTAKKCFTGIDASALMMIGGYKSPHFGRNSQVKFADRIIKHDKELAIIKLEKPFRFSPTVKPIRLAGPEKMDKDGQDKIKEAYPDPYGIVGFDIPDALIERTDYLPKISAYEMRDEFVDKCDDDKCLKLEDKEKKFYFCTNQSSGFRWTPLGSPAVIIQEKQYIQIAVLWEYKCTAAKKDEKGSKPGPVIPNPTNPKPGKRRKRQQESIQQEEERKQEQMPHKEIGEETQEPEQEESQKDETQQEEQTDSEEETEIESEEEKQQDEETETEWEEEKEQEGDTDPEFEEEGLRQATAAPAGGTTPKDESKPTLYHYIRVDKFYKWIKANSYIGR